MQKLLQHPGKNRILDLMNERLEFERSGVRLYDRILEQMRTAGDPNVLRMLDQMQEHRDQEKEHEEWLEAQVRALGGDAHSPTEHSALVKAESMGIEQVIMNDPQVPHLFHSLLTAELADNAGWDLLVQLADELGDKDAKKEFKKRLHEEEEHLLFVRRAMEKFALQEVTGEEQKMPKSP